MVLWHYCINFPVSAGTAKGWNSCYAANRSFPRGPERHENCIQINQLYSIYCYSDLLQYFRIYGTWIKCLLLSFPCAIFQNLWNWNKIFFTILSFCNAFRICGTGIKCSMLSCPFATFQNLWSLNEMFIVVSLSCSTSRIRGTGMMCS